MSEFEQLKFLFFRINNKNNNVVVQFIGLFGHNKCPVIMPDKSPVCLRQRQLQIWESKLLLEGN